MTHSGEFVPHRGAPYPFFFHTYWFLKALQFSNHIIGVDLGLGDSADLRCIGVSRFVRLRKSEGGKKYDWIV